MLSSGTCPKPFTGGEEVTRKHRCRMIEELIDLVFEWLEHCVPFEVERNVYIKRPAIRADHFPCCGKRLRCVAFRLTYDSDTGGDTRAYPGF